MQDEHGETAMFAACSQGHYDLAALLIDHGADVNYLSKVRPSHIQVKMCICSGWDLLNLSYPF